MYLDVQSMYLDVQTMYLDGKPMYSDVQTMYLGVFACVGAWRARPGVALPGFEGGRPGRPAAGEQLSGAENCSLAPFGRRSDRISVVFWCPGAL